MIVNTKTVRIESDWLEVKNFLISPDNFLYFIISILSIGIAISTIIYLCTNIGAKPIIDINPKPTAIPIMGIKPKPSLINQMDIEAMLNPATYMGGIILEPMIASSAGRGDLSLTGKLAGQNAVNLKLMTDGKEAHLLHKFPKKYMCDLSVAEQKRLINALKANNESHVLYVFTDGDKPRIRNRTTRRLASVDPYMIGVVFRMESRQA